MQRKHGTTAVSFLGAALAGGFAAIAGGGLFVAGVLALDLHGIRTLAAAEGWVRPLGEFAGLVGCFGLMGFFLGPALRGRPAGPKPGRRIR